MNRRRRSAGALIAGVAITALLAGPLPHSAATGGEEPPPEEPLPAPTENTYAVGQSVQIRTNADAEQNAEMVDFRWAITQVTVQGPDGTVDVPVPEQGRTLRSLQDFSRPTSEDGIVELPVDVENGVGTARTISLVPEDFTLAVELDAEFTLDGEPISAQDLVGKSGVVTAQYTLTNTTRTPVEVEVTDLNQQPVTRTVEADVPMVAIAKTLLPQKFSGLDTGTGIVGADGRGNNQVQWVVLPFAPINESGTSTFGWAANVQDAVIPSMLIQVAPIYIPAEGHETEAPTATESGGSAPNLDPAAAEIQAGLAQLMAGLEGFAASGGPDPLDVAEANINEFFTTFASDIQTASDLLDPNNPESAFSVINAVQEQVAAAQEALAALEASGIVGDLQEVIEPLTAILENAEEIQAAVNVACRNPGSEGAPTQEQCDAAQAAATYINSPEFAAAVSGLTALVTQLPGVITTLTPVLGALASVLATLETTLTNLSASVSTIADGLAASSVDLPPLDAVIQTVVNDIVNSPPGQDVTAGLAQIEAGVGTAKSIMSTYLAEVVATLQATGADANEGVIAVKSSVAGMVAAAHQSPLPFGGDPANAPPGTVLAGAYEFRVDAADGNHEATLPRILVGVLLLVGAGFLANWLVARRSRGQGPEPAPEERSVDEPTPA